MPKIKPLKHYYYFLVKKLKKKKLTTVLEFRHLQVQTLVSGGAGSKHTNQNPTMLRGILGIEEGRGCRLNYVEEVQEATPLTH